MSNYFKQRKLRKEINQIKTTKLFQRDEKGRVLITMLVKDDSHFLSEFSKTETPIISDAVADFLEDSTHSLLPNEKYVLTIESNCIDEDEKILYERAIKEYYTERYVVSERELRRNRIIAGVLSLSGMAVLGISILLDTVFNHMLWSEMINIVAWVLLWEAVDIIVFQSRSLKMKRLKYLAFISMELQYQQLDEKTNQQKCSNSLKAG